MLMHSIDYVPPSHAAARLMLETTQNETVFPQYFGLVGSWGEGPVAERPFTVMNDFALFNP